MLIKKKHKTKTSECHWCFSTHSFSTMTLNSKQLHYVHVCIRKFVGMYTILCGINTFNFIASLFDYFRVYTKEVYRPPGIMAPYKKIKFKIKNINGVLFSRFLKLAQINFEFLKNVMILVKIWPKVGMIGIMSGSLFIGELVYWSMFRFSVAYPYQKQI